MKKTTTKSGPGKELRLRAFQIFLQRRGHISQEELGRLVGRNRKTINRWSIQDDWDSELKKLVGVATSKAVEKVADTMADIVTESFRQDLEFLKMTDKIFSAKLLKRDASGRPVLSTDGKYMVDDSISVVDANRLVDARLKKVRAVQLIVNPQGKGTGSAGTTEQPAQQSGFNAALNNEFTRVLREGPPAVQEAMMTILKAAADIRAKSEGRHEDVVLLKDNVPDET